MADAKKSCGHCAKDLTGTGYITAGEKYFCQGHFICAVCKKDLHKDNAKYYDFDGKTLCADDFAKQRGLYCAKCNKIIDASEKAITALEKKWHTGCFVCAYCTTKLFDKKYIKVDGKPWCDACGKKHMH